LGGDACIVRTRIPVWALVEYRPLRPTDLAQAWAYAATHLAEIERALREQEAA